MILYTVPTANGQKAQVVLEELGFDYETRTADLVAGEHRTPEMLKLNPFGKLPFLLDDGEAVYGSMAIAFYLCEKAGKLIPDSLAERRDMYQWAGMLASDLSPALAGQFMFSEIFPLEDPRAVDYFVESACRLFAVLDEHLADRDYLVGDELTVTDLLAYPSAATSAARLPNALEPWPNIQRWAANIGSRSGVIRGMART
ncbi:MAG: glutathione S-transferase family protein [Pseudomonadota bacterium]